MTYNQKNQSIEIDPEMMELTNKDVKAAVINTFWHTTVKQLYSNKDVKKYIYVLYVQAGREND